MRISTTVAAAKEAHEKGLAVIMGAPNMVRGGSHSGNVAAVELAKLGYLDVLSSDYVPASLLSAAFKLMEQADFTIDQAVSCVSTNSAKAIGFEDRGSIEVGLKADIIQVQPIALENGTIHPLVRSVWRSGQKVL